MGFHKATSHFPDTFKDVEVKNFLEEYYEISNNRDAHEDYHQLFTNDAVFVIGSEKAKGRSGLAHHVFHQRHESLLLKRHWHLSFLR